MNRKQALIVDDSKTAQYLLKRMLQSYDLVIDVASSAEEALAYLSYNHPAVIFLDHQMTGMTGMEALKTIKANPHTALIPVIMYTSQNDDLFVSQAIALGAQGILSKSALQPTNLEQVLTRLNIRNAGNAADSAPLPERPPETEPPKAPAPQAAVPEPVPVVPAATIPDLDKVRAQIGRLFEIHIADFRKELNNSTQFIVKRLSTTIDKASSQSAARDNGALAATTLGTLKSTVAAAIASERRSKSTSIRALLGATFAGMFALGYLLLQIQTDNEAATQTILAALETKKPEPVAFTAALTSAMQDNKAPQPAVHRAMLQALAWAQSADFHFNYGEQPLSGARLSNLHQLVHLLAEGGYTGPLILNIHFGNFCLEADEANALRLAKSDTKLANCKMQKDLNLRFAVNDLITLQYRSFEQNLMPLRDGRITIRLETNGMHTPATEYPLVTPQTTAGEWNRAALRNNRIAVQFPE